MKFISGKPKLSWCFFENLSFFRNFLFIAKNIIQFLEIINDICPSAQIFTMKIKSHPVGTADKLCHITGIILSTGNILFDLYPQINHSSVKYVLFFKLASTS